MRLSILFLALALAGCERRAPAPSLASPYEGCRGGGGEPCGIGPTACRMSGPNGGALCTTECRADDDCLDIPGHRVACVPFTTGAECIAVCDRDDDCPAWTECIFEDRLDGRGGMGVCQPVTWENP
jgi:hypothetical protein